MENRKTPVMNILTVLLAVGLVAVAQPVAADPVEEVQDVRDCPVIAVLLYDPYIAYHPECLPTGGH
jgi:hypothetical protein